MAHQSSLSHSHSHTHVRSAARRGAHTHATIRMAHTFARHTDHGTHEHATVVIRTPQHTPSSNLVFPQPRCTGIRKQRHHDGHHPQATAPGAHKNADAKSSASIRTPHPSFPASILMPHTRQAAGMHTGATHVATGGHAYGRHAQSRVATPSLSRGLALVANLTSFQQPAIERVRE